MASSPFDPVRALTYLKELCEIGPRVSGSSGMARQRDWLRGHFEPLCDRFSLQEFAAAQASQGVSVPMANVVASWGPGHPDRVLLCAHYDTRPIADNEPDPDDWRRPFLGANDGASGVALLAELARHLREHPLKVGLDVVFFDGEEYIFDPENDHYFFGSTYFAKMYQEGKIPGRYRGAVLLDMVAGIDAEFPVEAFSAAWAGDLAGEIWGTAAELNCEAFLPQVAQDVMDDHLPLNVAGIPAVVVIDSAYPHWHRLTDTPEQCSAETLEQVATVLWNWLQRLA